MDKFIWNKKRIVLIASVVLALLLSFKDVDQLIDAISEYEGQKLTVILYQVIFSVITSFLLGWALFSINLISKFSLISRLVYSLVITAVLCLLGSLFIDSISEIIDFDGRSDSWEWHKNSITGSWLITKFIIVSITCYIGSVIYTLSQKKILAEKKYEILRVESLQSELKALNNQINPHFFFNALNSLHSLIIEDDKEKSLEYLVSLSDVFRYILRSENKRLVALCEELEFLDTYKYMLAVKYGEKLNFDIQIDGKYLGYRVPVLSLLPVIENVTKHNEISTIYPMVIKIFIGPDEETLVIKNKKRERLDEIHSEGFGLENLNTRFKLLMDKEIIINNTDSLFIVNLPLKDDKDLREKHHNL
jgi:sensor histidine kinase YesM